MKPLLVLVAVAPLLARGAEPVIAFPQREPLVPLATLREETVPAAIHRGATRPEVVTALGTPSLRLSADAWIYWNYQAGRPATGGPPLDTLVVLFGDGRVTGLRLLPRASVEALAARLRPAKPAATIAAQ